MALYDNYRLANSTQVPEYVGAPLAEMQRAGDALQRQYFTAIDNTDYLKTQLKYAKVHDKDRPLYEQTVEGYRKRIEERAKSGNYEDMVRATAMDAKEFGAEYAPFAENLKRRSDYRDDLEKNRKELNLSAATMDGLLRASEYNTKGLQRDPRTGQVVGLFQGITANKEIDTSAWTDEKLKGIIAETMGWDATSIQGIKGMSADGEKYYVQRGEKTVTVDAPRIKAVLRQAMDMDQDFQGHVKQQAMLKSLGSETVTPELLETTQQGQMLSNKIKEIAERDGITFGQAYQKELKQSVESTIKNGVMNYGVLKREQHDRDTKFNIRGETEETGRVRAKAYEDASMNLFYEGAVSGAPIKEDSRSLDSKITRAAETVADLTTKLNAATHPEDKTRLLNDLRNAKAQQEMYGSIVKGARTAEVARFENKIPDQVEGVTQDGKPVKLTKALMKALMEDGKMNTWYSGGVKTLEFETAQGIVRVGGKHVVRDAVPGITSLVGNLAAVATGNRMLGAAATGKASIGSGSAVEQFVDQAIDFKEKVDKTIKENGKNYAVRPTMGVLDKKTLDQVKTMISTDPGSVILTDMKGNTLADDERPVGLELGSYSIIPTNGSATLRAQALDEKGKPTGEFYNVVPAGNNNLKELIATHLSSKKNDSASRQVAASLRMSDWTPAVANTPEGGSTSIDIPNADNSGLIEVGVVKRERTPGGNTVYNFYLEGSKTPFGGSFTDPVELSTAINTMTVDIASKMYK